MSTMKDITSELMKLDLYEMLDIEPSAEEKCIKKAYRKKALKCHPDKNPDNPKAAEMFLKLSKALEILCDTNARSTYDHLLKTRKAAALRSREYDAQRKRLKDDLEAREKTAEDNKMDIRKDLAKLQAEIERLRKEGSRQLEEEQQIMREQLQKEREGLAMPESDDNTSSCRLRVRWKEPKTGIGEGVYDSDKLTSIFSKYGQVSLVVVSRKKRGSALVEMCSSQAASTAERLERGLSHCPLAVELIGQKLSAPKPPSAVASGTTSATMSKSSFDTFESLVLRNLRQAEERRKLVQQLKDEDD